MKLIKWHLALVLFCSGISPVLAQKGIYFADKTNVSFFSNAPLEDIEAKNDKAISSINVLNNEILVRIPISQFQFRNKLMQDHFNEKYMESEKYPTATFKGKINQQINFREDGIYAVSASGVLNVHGVNKKRTLSGTLNISNTGMVLDSNFDILLADHNIAIPRLVFNKIAERIEVKTSFGYPKPENPF